MTIDSTVVQYALYIVGAWFFMLGSIIGLVEYLKS